MKTATNIKGQVKVIQMISFALIMGPAIFSGVGYYLSVFSGQAQAPELHEIFMYIVPALAVISFMFSFFISTKYLGWIKKKETAAEKFPGYQTAVIIRTASLEGAALFSAVGLLITGEMYYLYLAGALIFVMIYFFPTKNRIATECDFNEEEYRELKKSTY